MKYFTSDWHLGHANIVKFCNRPYSNTDEVEVEAMNTAIVANMNAVVGEHDELWILGDVAMGKLPNTLEIINRVNAGHKVLVAGNHDRVHPSTGVKTKQWEEAYKSVFDEVIPTNTTLTLPSNEVVHVSHFPYTVTAGEVRAGSNKPDRFAPWRVEDDGKWLLCGHVHTAWAQQGRQINVGVDAWAGKPLSETQVMQIMEAGPTERGITAW